MPEQLQQVLDKALEWWKKFNTKQKALLASITAVVILSLVILAVVVSTPNMMTLQGDIRIILPRYFWKSIMERNFLR